MNPEKERERLDYAELKAVSGDHDYRPWFATLIGVVVLLGLFVITALFHLGTKL